MYLKYLGCFFPRHKSHRKFDRNGLAYILGDFLQSNLVTLIVVFFQVFAGVVVVVKDVVAVADAEAVGRRFLTHLQNT
jgi:hypothetical protein